MLFLTNDHIREVLNMKTCIDAMESAYRDLAKHQAGYRPRIDFYVPQLYTESLDKFRRAMTSYCRRIA